MGSKPIKLHKLHHMRNLTFGIYFTRNLNCIGCSKILIGRRNCENYTVGLQGKRRKTNKITWTTEQQTCREQGITTLYRYIYHIKKLYQVLHIARSYKVIFKLLRPLTSLCIIKLIPKTYWRQSRETKRIFSLTWI